MYLRTLLTEVIEKQGAKILGKKTSKSGNISFTRDHFPWNQYISSTLFQRLNFRGKQFISN